MAIEISHNPAALRGIISWGLIQYKEWVSRHLLYWIKAPHASWIHFPLRLMGWFRRLTSLCKSTLRSCLNTLSFFSSKYCGGHLQHHQRCLNNPIFFNIGLCAACWTHSVCHHHDHELCPTLVSHPFSFLSNSLCLAGEKYYQNITIPIFRLVLQNCASMLSHKHICMYRWSELSLV